MNYVVHFPARKIRSRKIRRGRRYSALLSDKSMDVIIIKPQTNPLSSSYHALFKDGECMFPTVEHYLNYRLISTLQDFTDIQAVLTEQNGQASSLALKKALKKKMPFDFQRVFNSRLQYLPEALRLKYDYDESFQRVLLATGSAVLIYADKSDSFLGVGLSEEELRQVIATYQLSKDNFQKVFESGGDQRYKIGSNQLGLALMALRSEVQCGTEFENGTAEAAVVNEEDLYYDDSTQQGQAIMNAHDGQLAASIMDPSDPGTSSFDPADQDVVNLPDVVGTTQNIIFFKGIFRPLSNFYAVSLRIGNQFYPSVQHYCYLQLLNVLGLGSKAEEVRSCENPVQVRQLTHNIIRKERVDGFAFEGMKALFDASFQTAMKVKFSQYPLLQKLLFSTGNALLVEDLCPEDRDWSIGMTEWQLRSWLADKGIRADMLHSWLRNFDVTQPEVAAFLGRNRAGLALMDIRDELLAQQRNADGEDEEPSGFVEFTVPPSDLLLNDDALMSGECGLMCFTNESVFSSVFASPIFVQGSPWCPNGCIQFPTAQHFVYNEAFRFLNFPFHCAERLLQTPPSHLQEAFNSVLTQYFPSIVLNTEWFYARQVFATKFACRLKFEQNPNLKRALLMSGNDILVFCSDNHTSESLLWSVGMTEEELRSFVDAGYIETSQLFACFFDCKAKPQNIGSNRLGLILMELRKEFAEGRSVPIPSYDTDFSFAYELSKMFGDPELSVKCDRLPPPVRPEQRLSVQPQPVVDARSRVMEGLKDELLRLVDDLRSMKREKSIMDEEMQRMQRELTFLQNRRHPGY